MLSPKPSTVSTRPRLSTAADHGETSRLSSSQPLNGSIGSTTEGSWSPLATYRRQRPSNATTPCWNKRPWRHNLNQVASGNPGAVQSYRNDAVYVGDDRFLSDLGVFFTITSSGITIDNPVFGIF